METIGRFNARRYFCHDKFCGQCVFVCLGNLKINFSVL